MSFFGELRRRNVVRVAIGYIAVAWLVVQVVETVFSIFGFSERIAQAIVIVLAIGFVPALVVAWMFEWTPDGLKRDAEADRSAPGVRARTRRFDFLVTAALLLAVVYFAVDKFVFDPVRVEEKISAAVEQAAIRKLVASYGDRSIAVLPFRNMSADPEQEYFADGMTEELLNLLAQVEELRVISRSSAFQYKGKEIHIPTVAGELNVAHVLEGSVRRAGDTIRVTAQLIDASDRHLWSDTYDREFKEIFAIQDEIATKVVDSLKIRLLGDAPKARKRDPEAYALYLKASYLLNLMTDERTTEASELLQEALLRDPDDPDILSAMGRVILRTRGDSDDTRRRLMPMIERIERADPGLASSWRAYFAIALEADPAAGARYIEAALRDSPSNDNILRSSISGTLLLGAIEEGVAIAEYVVAKDPLCAQCQYYLARAYRINGQLDEAEAAARAALILLPDAIGVPIYRDLGRTLFFKGEFEEALAMFERANEDCGAAAAAYELGRMTRFGAALQACKDEAADAWPSAVAWVYAAIGENEQAIEWLEKWPRTDPMSLAQELEYFAYRNLRDDPRFVAIQEEIGVSPAQLEAIDFRPPLPPAIARTLPLSR